MKKAIALIIIAAAVSGCVSMIYGRDQSISPAASDSLFGQTVGITVRTKPDFKAYTENGGLVFVREATAISKGNRIVSSNNIDDPAHSIGLSLARALESSHSVKAASETMSVTSDELDEIASSTPGYRFLIDVQTLEWGFVDSSLVSLYPLVTYIAKARIVDGQSKSVVAHSLCYWTSHSVRSARTYEELVGNNAARLKAYLAKAAVECVQQIRTKALGL